jgi:riboflavin kinase/FMN adenylyltransferase
MSLDAGTCVTVGNFDGMHVGHRALLAKARQKADQAGLPLVVVTFDPHPLEILAPDLAPARLTDPPARLELLRACGADVVLLLPFTRELAAMAPEDFVRSVLLEGLGMREMVIGYDFSLGKDRAGTGAVLGRLGAACGFACERFGPVLMDGAPVSSTRVRQLIEAGDMAGAAVLLGRPHSARGLVVRGLQRGRDLGFPTANLAPPCVLLPPVGVYATWATWATCASGERVPAVTSVGNNPTFGGKRLTVETHLLDFSGDLYGQELRVDFVQRLRGQIKFAGPTELVRRIEGDIRAARALLAVEAAK